MIVMMIVMMMMKMMITAAACRSVARSISTRPHDGFGGSRDTLCPPGHHDHDHYDDVYDHYDDIDDNYDDIDDKDG